jgi:hypothetical protein
MRDRLLLDRRGQLATHKRARDINLDLPYLIPDSRLRDDDVLAEFDLLIGNDSDHMAARNNSLTAALRSDPARPMLLRGVGFRSPSWRLASKGTVLPDSQWVRKDYAGLSLPDASYWSDPDLQRSEAFWAIGHAFGGDHPVTWKVAQRGIILAHQFELANGTGRPTDDALTSVGKAWKLDTGRDERLVFTRIDDCRCFYPWNLVRSATRTDVEADVLLGAAYLDYLRFEADNGISPTRAKRLLTRYRP